MSNLQYNLSAQQKDSISQMQQDPEVNTYKIPCTTKFTQNNYHLTLPESFILGKNDLLQETTQLGMDSDDNDSDISFEDRLELNHQKIMVLILNKYFSQNVSQSQNIVVNERMNFKSQDTIKQIEEKTLDEIERKYGTQESQKIKLVIKFFKKNQDTSKIYYEVIRRFSPQYRCSCFFLLKETVLTYLNARQEIKQESQNYDQNSINLYFDHNILKICKTIQQDEKLQRLKFHTHDNILNKKFEEFILTWMTTFYLSKEGFPPYPKQKLLFDRQWPFQTCSQADKRKKIKK